jgi:uncharacterized membrane protein
MNEDTERKLTLALVLVLVVSVAGVVYVSMTAGEEAEPFTEFYVVGAEGNASEYPTQLTVGETRSVVVGISNHEHSDTEYTVVLVLGNRTVTTRSATVANGRTWESEFSVTPRSVGRTDLRILLYRGEAADRSEDAYRRLRLRVWVAENGSQRQLTHHSGARLDPGPVSASWGT